VFALRYEPDADILWPGRGPLPADACLPASGKGQRSQNGYVI